MHSYTIDLLNGTHMNVFAHGQKAWILTPVDQVDKLDDLSLGASVRILEHEAQKCKALEMARHVISRLNDWTWDATLNAPPCVFLESMRHSDQRIQTAWDIITRRQGQYGQERQQRPGYVYLLQAGQYYKIGISKQVNERIKHLSTLPPFDIDLIHTIKTRHMYRLEECLHICFEPYRKNGEWFVLSTEHVEWIKGLQPIEETKHEFLSRVQAARVKL